MTRRHGFPHRFTALAVLALCGSASLAEQYSLPLFVTSTAPGTAQGVLRIVNGSGESGSVGIHAVDDAGTSYGPANFTLDAGTAVEFDATDLASGNAMKGLSPGLGAVSGDVRLEMETELQIVPLAYVRAADGTLSAMHDTVRAGVAAGGGGGYRYEVPIFNAAADVTQESRLRLINPGDQPAAITIGGRDDTGAEATGGTVRFTLPAGGARTLTAQQLEAGDTGAVGRTGRAGATGEADEAALTGRLGAGVGRWRLSVSSDRLIRVVNIVSASAGYLVNLSTTAVAGAAPTDHGAFNQRFGAGGIRFRSRGDLSTYTLPAADRFRETGESEGAPSTRGGSFRYEAIRADAGLVTLLYDDGDVCRTNLYFESTADGRYASRCTGAGSPDGYWTGGSWSTADRDEIAPEDPAGVAQQGDCFPGLLVRMGATCAYPGTDDEFSINVRGRGQFLDRLAGIRIDIRDETIDGRVYDLRASHEGDGEWLIERVAGRTQVPSFGTTPNPDDRTYTAGTAIDPLTLPEATGGNGTLRYSLSPDVPGLSFDSGTRELAGTPTAAGAYNMTYTVSDTDGDTDTLSFTITVEAAEEEDDGSGDTGGGSSDAVSVEGLECTARRIDATSIRVKMMGNVRAHRSLLAVRAIGYVEGLYLGADLLGDMDAGSERMFEIEGEIEIAANRITCNVQVRYTLPN